MYHSDSPGFDQIVLLLVGHCENTPVEICDRCLTGSLVMTLVDRAVQRGAVRETEIDQLIETLEAFRDAANEKRHTYTLMNMDEQKQN